MPALTVKNLPEDLLERLRERSAANGRSLNSEVIACLRSVVMVERVDAATLLATAARLRVRVGGHLTESVLREAKATGRP